MIVTLALAALTVAPDLTAIPRHADAVLFALAFAGLVIGRRLSPKQSNAWRDDGE